MNFTIFVTMNQFIEKVKGYISENGIFSDGQPVIVGLSGGADSVALLVTLHTLGYRCIAAHCNFHLRGEESQRDFRHARSIAEKYSTEFVHKDFNVPEYKERHGVSTEMACRDLRYDWFRELSADNRHIPVAVAHHLDDNIETLFLNLLRGTGINGAHGMSPRNGIIARPFLSVTRNEILEFLAEEGADYITDSSNLINDVKRNKLRNIVLPAVKEQFPEAEKGLTATLNNLRSNDSLYQEMVRIVSSRYISDEGIDVAAMIDSIDNSALLLYEIIKDKGFNFTQAADIIEATRHEASGKQFYAAENIAVLDRGLIKITSAASQDNDIYHVSLQSTGIDYPITLHITRITPEEMVIDRSGKTLYLDDRILNDSPTLTLRRWRDGDRFCPYGMKGSKLVSDIFSDLKLSILDKQKVWLLCDNDKILWIIGIRGSKFYPVTDTTQEVIRIELSSTQIE